MNWRSLTRPTTLGVSSTGSSGTSPRLPRGRSDQRTVVPPAGVRGRAAPGHGGVLSVDVDRAPRGLPRVRSCRFSVALIGSGVHMGVEAEAVGETVPAPWPVPRESRRPCPTERCPLPDLRCRASVGLSGHAFDDLAEDIVDVPAHLDGLFSADADAVSARLLVEVGSRPGTDSGPRTRAGWHATTLRGFAQSNRRATA